MKCALKAVGVQQGDEVITQSFNFIATIEAIVDCGAKPVICDIDENLHLSIDNLMERITKTKAIIIVHMLGMGGDIKKVVDLGKKLNLPIIEDNCEAIGAKCNDRYLGTIADIGVMSLIMANDCLRREGWSEIMQMVKVNTGIMARKQSRTHQEMI